MNLEGAMGFDTLFFFSLSIKALYCIIRDYKAFKTQSPHSNLYLIISSFWGPLLFLMILLTSWVIDIPTQDFWDEEPKIKMGLGIQGFYTQCLLLIASLITRVIILEIKKEELATKDDFKVSLIIISSALAFFASRYFFIKDIAFCQICIGSSTLEEIDEGGPCNHNRREALIGYSDTWSEILKVAPSLLWLSGLVGASLGIFLCLLFYYLLIYKSKTKESVNVEPSELRAMLGCNNLLVEVWTYCLYAFCMHAMGLFYFCPIFLIGLLFVSSLLRLRAELEHENLNRLF